VCFICGSASHYARDCPKRNEASAAKAAPESTAEEPVDDIDSDSDGDSDSDNENYSEDEEKYYDDLELVLPEGWESRTDKESGDEFYIDFKTKS